MRPSSAGRRPLGGGGGDAQAGGAQRLERALERVGLPGRDLDAQDAGEAAAEANHAALEPVAAAISDGLRNRLDQTRSVGSNQRENEIDHGCPCLTIPYECRPGLG